MIDLTTRYLGLKLKSPLVASASPLSRRVDLVRRIEAAGAGAIVMYSLFEEQIAYEHSQLDYFLNRGSDTYPEALTYFPSLAFPNLGPEPYLDQIRQLKAAVDIPVIASLNGVSTGGWIEYAAAIEAAGADALELNIYYLPTDAAIESAQLEEVYLSLVRDVRAQTKIPLAVKLSPFFTALPAMARKLAAAGADGLVLFNRFYQPDLDLETLEVVPNLDLSTSHDLRLPLRWIALLHGRVPCDLALTSGVHTAEDALKALMAGANVAMMTSALLRNGIERLADVLEDMKRWLETHEYESTDQLRGSMSQQGVAEPAAFERANYMEILHSLDNLVA